MVRHDLSQPVSLLVRHNLIKAGVSVFDYGCGQGDDLRILNGNGLQAAGWDPHFRPEAARCTSDVVNLGFVLNVIENPLERRAALANAWALAGRVLAVSTMVTGQVSVAGLRPHGDGFLTSRGTFQKYFGQSELSTLISQALSVAPVAVAPGIFFVFRDPEDEQEFLLNRRHVRRLRTTVPINRSSRARATELRPSVQDRIPFALEELSALIRRRGRVPMADELSKFALVELAEQRVSLARAVETCLAFSLSPSEVESAAATRLEDLLVHHALALLNRSPTIGRPSPGMTRDIRAHLGSQKELVTRATAYLYGLANEEKVRRVMQDAFQRDLGLLDHRGRLIVDGDRTEELPGLLRCYLGCASSLSGELDGRFLARIDAARRRVTLWPVVDANQTFPETEISVRVDLSRQDVSIRPDPRRLLRKGELEGSASDTKQRRLQDEYVTTRQLGDAVFERIDPQ
jgi:DNA phosphorothioation-associated putative methyltransferase